jgi:hypothetical protein
MRSVVIAVWLLTSVVAKDVPSWITESARTPSPSGLSRLVDAVVLLHEETLIVDASGRRSMRERSALRIVNPKRAPEAIRAYNTRSGRLKESSAWIVRPTGQPVEVPKSRVFETAAGGDLYEEYKLRVIPCEANLPEGSVFAYEFLEDEDTSFTTYQHSFQAMLPVVISRFSVTLPADWESKATLFNHQAIEPKVEGSTYTWELRGLDWIEPEPFRPRHHALAPRLALTYFPSSSAKPELRPLPSWEAVSAWLAGMYETASAVSSPLTAKAAALTSAAGTDWERIQAIAAFVQSTNYQSIQMNLTHGGGYTPNPAALVLSRNYGDCKDKATLMRALLRAVGIESYPVAIYSSDRTFVRPEWPSPHQFNHAIIAVRVPESIQQGPIVPDPNLGRILFFDPTDPDTPLGGLPLDEQGSHALVIAPAYGRLMLVPALDASQNRSESSASARVAPDGRLEANLLLKYYGQAGRRFRAIKRSAEPDALRKDLQTAFSNDLPGAVVKTVSNLEGSHVELRVDLEAASFGQLLQGRLLILKPGLLLADTLRFPAKDRKWPVRLEESSRSDQVSLPIPAGFEVDEMPLPFATETPYGKYEASWKIQDGVVTLEQRLQVKRGLFPATAYPQIHRFFESVAGSQAAPVVLIRQ